MVDRAPTILEQRCSEFFSIARAGANTRPAWSSMHSVWRRLNGRGWKTYVVGGTIRDVLLAPPGELPRDVDLIVQGAQPGELETVFGDLLDRRTRFGGLRLAAAIDRQSAGNPTGGVLHFDIWRMEDTWGIRNANLTASVDDFVKTPFLNIDSVAVELGPVPPRISEHRFFEAVENRLLDINYAPNPFPFVCSMRAMVIASKLDFALSARLGAYILRRYREGAIAELMAAQISHYGVERYPDYEILDWIEQIETAIHSGVPRIELSTATAESIAR